ncbi:MAG: phosphate ABC transporter permease PstA [bacterium]
MNRLARRKLTSRVAAGVCILFAFAALYPLYSVLSIVVSNGWRHVNWEFLTTVRSGHIVKSPGSIAFVTTGGIQHAIVGTGLVVGIGTLLGAPLGILAGIHLAEARPSRLTATVRVAADAMAGIPSIVAGLFGFALIVATAPNIFTHDGYSAWAGGVALAVLMVPTVTRTTEEALRTVPQSLREASLALGAPGWYTIIRVVLPAAWGAVTTGLLLGVARIAGETAPLLLTAGTSGSFLQTDPSKPVTTLPFVIYDYYKQRGDLEGPAWGAALVLISMILVLNLTVRLLSRRRLPV